MKKAFLYILLAISLTSCDEVVNSLGDGNIVEGLKQALTIATDTAVHRLSAPGGYLDDQIVKIGLPPQAETTFKAMEALQTVSSLPLVGDLLSSAGLGINANYKDILITAFNRAAEDAAPQATQKFVSAITNMTIADGKTILMSDDTIAATRYLRTNTETDLIGAFGPVISESLSKVEVTAFDKSLTANQVWDTYAEQNNKLADFIASSPLVQTALGLASKVPSLSNEVAIIQSVKRTDTDLGVYVTGEALNGLFTKVGSQEHKIRTDVNARVTDLLRDVFAKQDK